MLTRICIYFLMMWLLIINETKAQNRYGLHVLTIEKEYVRTVDQNINNRMVDVTNYVDGVMLDLKYSSAQNFLHKKLYPKIKTTYLRKPAAEALAKVQIKLSEKGLGLKIWDAYRPYTVTVEMWEAVKDSRYAADPKFGSGHNRGIAVDVTIVELLTGKEIDMGTGFDHFSDTAHTNFTELPPSVLQNRRLLQSEMEAEGFKVLDTEWWHFYLPDSKSYALLGLSFSQLKKITKHYKLVKID